MRRDGYFKVDETEAHAAVIFPAKFQHNLSAVDTMRLIVSAGISTRLQYFATVGRMVPITENGVGQ